VRDIRQRFEAYLDLRGDELCVSARFIIA